MTNKYQKNMSTTSSGAGLAVPEAVTIAMGEIAEDMREGLLALAVGAGGLGVRAPRQTRPRPDRGAPRA